jgi:hypothetical protein
MKWITLKIYLLPVIMQEVDTVTEKYINFLNEIRRTNDNETIDEFQELRESVISFDNYFFRFANEFKNLKIFMS